MKERSPETPVNLKYTICFCRVDNKVLMVHRIKEPNKDMWNGLGGKIEPNETPKESVFREMREEAEMDLNKANGVNFVGTVTWDKHTEPPEKVGMYSFVVDLPSDYPIWEGGRETPEGSLEWKDVSWASDQNNKQIVDNIPHFLPPMLENQPPVEYYFVYEDGKFVEMITHELPSDLKVE